MQRNKGIDFLKLLFTIMIMLFHSGKAFLGGYIAVDFFFIVSGFLMASKMSNKKSDDNSSLGEDALHFIIHKAIGIFPYYVIAFIFSSITYSLYANLTLNQFILKLIKSPYNFFMLEMAGNYDMGFRVRASWYISAMLISMLVLYPLRKKYESVFDNILAPLIFLFFIGYAYQQGKGVGNFVVEYDMNILMYRGLLRSFAEISLGCIVYKATSYLNRKSFNKITYLFIVLLELFGYIATFIGAYKYKRTDLDLALIFYLALSVSITFSNHSFLTKICRSKIYLYFGQLSLMLYLSHEAVRVYLMRYLHLDSLDTVHFLVCYFVLTFVVGMIIKFIGDRFKLYFKSI